MLTCGSAAILCPEQVRATSELYWISAFVTAAIDVVAVALLIRLVPRDRFRQLGRLLAWAGTIFWIILWASVLWSFTWEWCYQYLFPTWARWVVPPAYGLLFGGVVWVTWRLALKLEVPPVVSYTVMGGLASLPGHTIAVVAFNMFDRCPILREVSVASALTFGVFEFGFYWCAILCIAMLLQRVGKGWARLRVHHA
jgi:hypothetical protein